MIFRHPCFYVVCACIEFFGEVGHFTERSGFLELCDTCENTNETLILHRPSTNKTLIQHRPSTNKTLIHTTKTQYKQNPDTHNKDLVQTKPWYNKVPVQTNPDTHNKDPIQTKPRYTQQPPVLKKPPVQRRSWWQKAPSTKKILMAEGPQYKEDPDGRRPAVQRRSWWQKACSPKKILMAEGLQSKEAYCRSTVEGYVSVSGVLMVLVNNDMQWVNTKSKNSSLHINLQDLSSNE